MYQPNIFATLNNFLDGWLSAFGLPWIGFDYKYKKYSGLL